MKYREQEIYTDLEFFWNDSADREVIDMKVFGKKVLNLVKNTQNDQELGEKIRKLYKKIK